MLYSTHKSGTSTCPRPPAPTCATGPRPATPSPNCRPGLALDRTWAPGVVRLDGRYLLYFTVYHKFSGRQCIGVATSAPATGPFAPAAVPLVYQTQLGGSIDPYPFVDRGGNLFLLWKADPNAIGQPSTPFAQRLAPDALAPHRPTGRAADLAGGLGAAAHREPRPGRRRPHLPAAVLRWLVGVRRLRHWLRHLRHTARPLHQSDRRPAAARQRGDQAGPGGACLVTGPAGDHWLAYHGWSTRAIGYINGGTRSLHFASLTWTNDQPVVGPDLA